MSKLIRNLAVLIGGLVLFLPLLATLLLITSSGASNVDNGNMLLSQLDNSLLQNTAGKTTDAFSPLEQTLQHIAGLGGTVAHTNRLHLEISKFLQTISPGNLEGTGLMTDGSRNRMAQPFAMIILGAGMIALATLRRKQTRSQSRKKPEPDTLASRMAYHND
jgi:hypothetical protein